MSLLARIVLIATWTSLLGAGVRYAWSYDATPGRGASAIDVAGVRWPGTGALELDRKNPTLLLFVHPACPCTKATLDEIQTLRAHYPDRSRLVVVLVEAPGLPGDVLDSPTARTARDLPDTTVIRDADGALARRFGAATSGQLVAYSPKGASIFRGGMTSSRGTYGPSDGLRALEAILAGRTPASATSPVFGCSLLGEVRS